VIASVTVVRMSEHETDPARNTQQFRAFAQSAPAESGQRISVGLIILIVAAIAAVVAVIAGLTFS
jgi:hypothetical protein